MKIKKIKYRLAVAALSAATAFCGCSGNDSEMIPLSEVKKAQYDTSDGSGFNKSTEKSGSPETAETSEKSEKTEKSEKNEKTAGSGKIRVYICGSVAYPGVYTVDENKRVIDAVDAAGGFLADADARYVNLAAKMGDGQQIYIPTYEETEALLAEGGMTALYGTGTAAVGENASSKGTFGGASDSTGLVDINSADRQTLMTLPGIGESKADKIIEYRDSNGGFSAIEDLMLVGGIKEGLFNKVKDKICVK